MFERQFSAPEILALLDACGAPQGEGDIQQAERIFYRGQAAALVSVDRRWSGNYRDDDRLIEQLLSDNETVPEHRLQWLITLRARVQSHGECPGSRDGAKPTVEPLRLPKRPRLPNWLKISSRRKPSLESGIARPSDKSVLSSRHLSK